MTWTLNYPKIPNQSNHRFSFIKKSHHRTLLKDFGLSQPCFGGFHLHLLVLPFVCQFHSTIEAIIYSSFTNDYFRRISASFQHHFKIVCCNFYMKKNVTFTLITFVVLIWYECLSVQVTFENRFRCRFRYHFRYSFSGF